MVAAQEGSWIEIECLAMPDPDKSHTGEWTFYVVDPSGQKFGLVMQNAQEKIIHSPEGMFRYCFTKLSLTNANIPLRAGTITTGMRSSPK